MKKPDDKRVFTTIRIPKNLATWLKIEAAKAGTHIYTLIEKRFPEVETAPKK